MTTYDITKYHIDPVTGGVVPKTPTVVSPAAPKPTAPKPTPTAAYTMEEYRKRFDPSADDVVPKEPTVVPPKPAPKPAPKPTAPKPTPARTYDIKKYRIDPVTGGVVPKEPTVVPPTAPKPTPITKKKKDIVVSPRKPTPTVAPVLQKQKVAALTKTAIQSLKEGKDSGYIPSSLIKWTKRGKATRKGTFKFSDAEVEWAMRVTRKLMPKGKGPSWDDPRWTREKKVALFAGTPYEDYADHIVELVDAYYRRKDQKQRQQEQKAKRIAAVKPSDDVKRSLMSVEPSYAKAHPDATVKIDGKYYRPIIPTEAMAAAKKQEKSTAKVYEEAMMVISAPDTASKLAVIEETGAVVPIEEQRDINQKLKKINSLSGKDRFDMEVEEGFIPKGSLYAGEGLYIPPEQVEAYKASLEAEREYDQWLADFRKQQKDADYSDADIDRQLKEIASGGHKVYDPKTKDFVSTYREEVEQREAAGLTTQERDEIYSGKYTVENPVTGKPMSVTKKQKADWDEREAKHIKLTDPKTGKEQWMAIEDFNELYKYDQEHGTNYQGIGIRQGYDAMLLVMDTDKKAAEKALAPYKVPDTEDSYYLDKAIRDKVPEKTLLVLFGKEVIDEAKRKPKEVSFSTIKIAPAQSVFKVTKSGRELENKYPEFTQAIIATTKTADPMDLSVHYGRWVDAWYDAKNKLGKDKVPTLKQYMVSLRSQMRDYTTYIKSLPKDSPERKLFNEELIRRGITTAAFVATVAAPYTFGAIGTVGTQIVSKVVPATIRGMHIIGGIPRLAVLAAQYLGTATPIVYTGATISEAVQTTDLEHKWQAFEALPAPKQDAWAKRTGYDSFQTLTDSEKANVLLHYAVPPGYSVQQWSTVLGKHTEQLIDLSQKNLAWLQENAPEQLQPAVIPLRIAGGVIVGSVVESTSYMAQLPLISAVLVDKVPSGTTKEFAKEVAAGMAAFFTTAIPAAFKADPYFTAGRMVGLFVLTPQAILKLSKSGFAGLKPSYVPERAMGMEFSTIRVEFTPKQWVMTGKMTPAQLKALFTNVEAALLAGKDYVKGFGPLKLEVKTVPYQKVVGNALFHFTPDITPFKGQVPIKGKLYTSPQAAVRAGLGALVKGEKAIHSGIVEVRVPEGFTIKGAPIDKLIGRGKTIEIEAPLKGMLDPIPGWQGKGISSNAYFGSYPIRRFTLRGVDTPIVKLSVAKLAEIRARAMAASVADAFVGWHGRMQAIKRQAAANKRLTQTLKDIETSIAKLKKGEVEVIGKNGEIISQRQPIPHPTKAGTIKPHVTTIVRNSKGEIMLVMDRAETSFGLPGGQISIGWKKGKLGFTRLPDGRRVLTPEGAAHGQIKSETGVGLTETRLLDTYTGKLNEHSLSGSRIYEALAKTDKIDISVGKGELKLAKWWNGKTEITVYPATYDILAAVAKKYRLDMSKVKIDTTRPILNRTRDTGFASRVATGEKLTPSQIKNVNNIEIASLKAIRNEISNPSLWDYLKGETDFTLLAELIKGRRQAVKWSQAKPAEIAKFTKEVLNNLKEIKKRVKSMTEAEVKSQYGISKAELLKRLDTKKLEKAKTPEAFKKEVERLANEQAKLANRRLAQEDIRAYVERGDYLNRRYVSYFDRAMRALGAGIPYSRIPEELVKYRPTPAEIHEEYRAVVPYSQRYELPIRPFRPEPIRPVIKEVREVPYRPPEQILPERVPPERVPPPTYRVPPPRVPPPIYKVPPPRVPPPIYKVPPPRVPPPTYKVPPPRVPPPTYRVPPPKVPPIYRVPPPSVPPTYRVPPPRVPPTYKVPPPRVPPPTYKVPPPPYRVPPPRVPPPPPPPLLLETQGKEVQKEFLGAVAWRQGMLKREATPEDYKGAITWKQGFGWYAIDNIGRVAFLREPPPEAIHTTRKTAYDTIQKLYGKAPEKLTYPMGIMQVEISKPTKKDELAIKFIKNGKALTDSEVQAIWERTGNLESIYKVWKRPYGQKDLETFFKSELPAGIKITPGGMKSAYKSIQLFKGAKPPLDKTVDIGAFLATIKAPTEGPGKKGAIQFKVDPSERRSIAKVSRKLKHKKSKTKKVIRINPSVTTVRL